MRRFLKGTLAILLVCVSIMSNSLLAKEAVSPIFEPLQNEVKVREESTQFTQANIFPFLGDNSEFPWEFNKSNLLLISIILSITLLVFAHKNNFETDIYAFYHTNRDGSVTFESNEAQRAYELRSLLAKTFRILGILTAFASVIMIFL
ncbi:hypothetical protein M3O96_03480 [Aquiflexum sp. TKW24L]|uniref:hypothetical protein n=1 Tax=Aquiflexum sp. TKW24L TaxID=2942212 RepID=UPI0020C0E876|nr:hypothetical protein [Aquiflexum sp. TKW24L]MCL6258132.1 hypothetical protein [Aquiflexum sp. TKW24L]